jgi:predicted dithiol-disulfide oxidoreductase (DUF899 family)
MSEINVGTREEWQAAREALLAREKELTRRNDELARERRELPATSTSGYGAATSTAADSGLIAPV